MGQKWIIDVIGDLRAFAEQNGLPLLAAQLDVSATLAQSEIASVRHATQRAATADTSRPASPFGRTRSGNGK